MMIIKFMYNDEVYFGRLLSVVNEGEKPFVYKPYANSPIRTNENIPVKSWGRLDEFIKLTGERKIDYKNVKAPCKLYWLWQRHLSWGVNIYYLIPKENIIEYDV